MSYEILDKNSFKPMVVDVGDSIDFNYEFKLEEGEDKEILKGTYKYECLEKEQVDSFSLIRFKAEFGMEYGYAFIIGRRLQS